MEALMPGSAGGDVAPRPLGQRKAISIKGLTPGVAYHLAGCCHPIPGDRIVGLGARTRRSRSTSSAATPRRAGSTPIGSTSPGAKARTAARRGWR